MTPTQSHWRLRARAAITEALARYDEQPHQLDPAEEYRARVTAIDAAYPFGPREHWPYKMWLIERKAAIMAAYPDLFPQAGKPCPVCGSKPGAMCVEIGTGDPRPPHEARLATPGSGPLFGGAT